MSEEQPCCICSEIRGERDNDLIAKALGGEFYIRRVALEAATFAVLPSLGPLAPGHVLLCPKGHYRSFAALPRELHPGFEDLKQRLTGLLCATYGGPVHYFEHGMASRGGRVVCTVEHAHLHAVPSFVDVWHCLNSEAGWEAVNSGLDNLKLAVGGLEYLYYELPDGKRYICRALPGEFESQYLRRIFARELGSPDKWDWRECPAAPAAHAIYERLRNAAHADPFCPR
jgi:diadenosine tetraphosphate (Ap4A) HIT family hydrolase